MRYTVVIEKTNNGYSAYAPDLPGCVAAAETRAEVRDLIKEAILLHVHSLREHGDPIPDPQASATTVSCAVMSPKLGRQHSPRPAAKVDSEVPTGWKVAQLGDLAEVIGGTTPSRSKPEYWGGEIPWVVPSELTNLPGRYLTETRESITEAGVKSAGLRIVPAGSILLTSRATIGLTAINAIPVATNQGFQNLVPGDEVDHLWLFYRVSALSQVLQRRAAGSTFLEVSSTSVRSLPILLPPLSEQRAMARILNTIDEAIERNQAVLDGMRELKASTSESLLAGRMRVLDADMG